MSEIEVEDLESEEVEHSILGASSAHRWMNCPGSIGLMKKLGPGKCRHAGMAARLGTAAHTLAATCLEQNREPWEFIGTKIDDFTVDVNMADAVLTYVAYNAGRRGEAFTEVKLQSSIDEDAFGTADRIFFLPGEYVHIIDYKHGAGVVVEPDSPQLKYYGALAFDNRPAWMKGKRDPQTVFLTVVQPRIPHPKGVIRTYETTPKALSQWFDNDVVPAMKETRKADAPLIVGSWCQFCPARDRCPALKRETLEFESSGVSPEYLTGDELGELMARCEVIGKYAESLKKEAFSRVLNGGKVKGFKLVHKIANRAWKNGGDAALVDTFGDAAYKPREYLSPARVEEDLPGGKSFVTQWAFKPQTGYTLAKESDRRGEVNLREDYFSVLPDCVTQE